MLAQLLWVKMCITACPFQQTLSYFGRGAPTDMIILSCVWEGISCLGYWNKPRPLSFIVHFLILLNALVMPAHTAWTFWKGSARQAVMVDNTAREIPKDLLMLFEKTFNIFGINNVGFVHSSESLQSREWHFHVQGCVLLMRAARVLGVWMLCSQLTPSVAPASQSLYGSSGWPNWCRARSAGTPLLPRQRWSQHFPSRYATAGSQWSSCSLGRYLQGDTIMSLRNQICCFLSNLMLFCFSL